MLRLLNISQAEIQDRLRCLRFFYSRSFYTTLESAKSVKKMQSIIRAVAYPCRATLSLSFYPE